MTSSHEFDIDFRPATYWDPQDVLIANIMGDARKACVIDTVNEGRVEELPPEAFTECMQSDERQRFKREGRGGFTGGESPPEYLTDEVEIARLTIDPAIRTVIVVRARREDGLSSPCPAQRRCNHAALL